MKNVIVSGKMRDNGRPSARDGHMKNRAFALDKL